jgi:hypothetical protein
MEEKSIEKMTVAELKSFLRRRGQPVCGKKHELVARSHGCVLLNIPIGGEKREGEGKILGRLYMPLQTASGETLPDPSGLDGWTNLMDLQEFPPVQEKDMINYLLHSRAMDSKQMAADRALPKAKVMADEGHLLCLEWHHVSAESEYAFVRAQSLPSLPSKDANQTPAHKMWICLIKASGHIHSAYCSCTAG